MEILSFFKQNKSYKTSLISLILTIIVGLLAYNKYFIYEYTNPDGIIEGLTYFNNATWVLTGCGRWFLAIFSLLSANVVMPFASVIGYCICVWLSAFVMCKTWKIKSELIYIIIPIMMVVSPTIIVHFSYNAIAFPYSVALLLATLFVFFNIEYDNIIYTLFSIACLTLSLGIFQSYIGYAACLCLMTLILKLIQQEDLGLVIKRAIKLIVSAIIACILYYLALITILKITNLEMVSRMAETSVSKTISNLIPNIISTYSVYLSFLNDSMFQRRIIYFLMFVSIIFCFTNMFLKKKKNILLSLVLFSLVPFTSNVVNIIITQESVSTSMVYQNILLVVFAIALYDFVDLNKYASISKYITIALSLILCWTYIISANATFSCYKLSYNFINNQMSQVVYDIEHNNEYQLNETPVIIVGFPDESALRENIRTYKYAIDLPESAAFWKIPVGTTYNRQKYFIDYFGLDFKDIDNSEYERIINSSEFKKMNNWPSDNSIVKIDKYLVIKLSDDYVK